MGTPTPQQVEAAIVADLEAHEFRTGEFYYELARKHGVSAWSVRMIAVREKRQRGR